MTKQKKNHKMETKNAPERAPAHFGKRTAQNSALRFAFGGSRRSVRRGLGPGHSLRRRFHLGGGLFALGRFASLRLFVTGIFGGNKFDEGQLRGIADAPGAEL